MRVGVGEWMGWGEWGGVSDTKRRRETEDKGQSEEETIKSKNEKAKKVKNERIPQTPNVQDPQMLFQDGHHQLLAHVFPQLSPAFFDLRAVPVVPPARDAASCGIKTRLRSVSCFPRRRSHYPNTSKLILAK